jgi:uncharacterized protein
MINRIDIHAHYGKWPFVGRDAEIEDIKAAMKKHDIQAFFLSSSKAIMYDFIEGNHELFSNIADVQGLYGYVVVNPNYMEESLDEVRKYADNPKFIGVKYHPEYCKKPADCEEMIPLFQMMEALNAPVLIHTFGDGLSSPLRLHNVNSKFPNVKLIAAHMGGNRFDLGIQLAKEANQNVFLEICSTDISCDKIKLAMDAAGAERILFGTDYSLFDPSYTIGAVESSQLANMERQMLFYENALKVFTRFKER